MSLPSRGTRSAPGPAKILPLGVWAEAEGARPGRHHAQYSYGESGRLESFLKELKKYRLPGYSDRDPRGSVNLKNTVKQMLGDVYYQMGGLSSVRWDQKLWKETYTYDQAGNRQQVQATRGTIDYVYDADNRLKSAGNRSYTYDDNGNQLTETVGDETVSMGYTPDNRLKTYSRMSSAPVVGEDEDETPHQVSYAYDAQGRRVAKSQWGREGSKTQTYQYEGMGLDLIRISDAQRLTTSDEEADEDELLRRPLVESERALVVKPRSREHYEGNGMDIVYANGRVFSSLSQNKGLTIYTTDVLGSVRFTSNNHDWAQHTYDYDAFGTSLRTPPSLFGYNGKVYDPVTASYNYGYRDYAPKQGRFTTVDPIQDGSNWYVYCNIDPIDQVDETGLSSSDAITPTFGNTDAFYKPLVSSIPSTGNSIVDTILGGVVGLANVPTAAMNFIAGDAFQATGNFATGKGTVNDGLSILAAAVPLVKLEAKATEGLVKVESAVLKAFGGPGGGHHIPAKSAFEGAAGYDAKKALAIPNEELARLGVAHSAVTGAQMTGYKALEKTGAPLTWSSAASVETSALVKAGMDPGTARATVDKAIQALRDSGVSDPTRIPWSK